MTKKLSIIAILLVFLIAGCSQEKAQVTTFLQELETSTKKMEDLGKEMQTATAGLQQEIASGNFDPTEIKGKIDGFVGQMKAEKDRIQGLSVPEKAKGLHEVTLKHYQAAIDLLSESGPMLDLAAEMAGVANKIKKDPTKAKQAMEEMKPIQEKMMALQAKLGEKQKEGQKLEEEAKAAQKKLREEFGIPTADATPGAASSTPAAETPAAVATP